MEAIQILANGMYLPKKVITNEMLAQKFGITCQSILEKTGIQKRYEKQQETLEQMAQKAVEDLLDKTTLDKNKIDMIIVASTSTKKLMPGISYFIQKQLEIKRCICMDLLAGCNGYINALDIARNYIALGKVKYALIIGCEALSDFLEKEDVDTALLLSDGAGATLIGKAKEQKQYDSCIESMGEKGDILTCSSDSKIQMNGKAIYKYAVTDTVRNIKELLEQTQETLDNIKYIVPHQSNLRILQKMAERLGIPMEKMYTNIEQIGNTFCASIPIALCQMFEEGLLKSSDKIILIGYGGGLNHGSILMEV